MNRKYFKLFLVLLEQCFVQILQWKYKHDYAFSTFQLHAMRLQCATTDRTELFVGSTRQRFGPGAYSGRGHTARGALR